MLWLNPSTCILSYMIYCNFMLLIRSGDLVLIFGIFASICTGTWDDLRLSASLFASNSLVAWPSAVPATVFSGSPQNIKKTSSKQIDISTRWHLGPFSKFPYCSMYSYHIISFWFFCLVSCHGFGWVLIEQNHRLLASVLTGRQIHHGERCQGCGGHHQRQVACAACQGQGFLSFASGCLCPNSRFLQVFEFRWL